MYFSFQPYTHRHLFQVCSFYTHTHTHTHFPYVMRVVREQQKEQHKCECVYYVNVYTIHQWVELCVMLKIFILQNMNRTLIPTSLVAIKVYQCVCVCVLLMSGWFQLLTNVEKIPNFQLAKING